MPKKEAAELSSILILAHSWPPDANVGSVRPVYLARQLVRLGWYPIVVIVRERYYELQNTSTPILVLRAIGELIAEGRLDSHKLTLRFVGPCQYAGDRPVTEMIAENKLDGVAEIVGFVPRAEALREMLRANVLVLLGTQRLTVAAKTYEYMAAGKPILAIVEEGAESDI